MDVNLTSLSNLPEESYNFINNFGTNPLTGNNVRYNQSKIKHWKKGGRNPSMCTGLKKEIGSY